MEVEKMTLSVASEEKKKAFIRDANGSILPNVENFYNFCAEGKLMAVKCKQCGAVICPPRDLCPKCFTRSMEWTELRGRGKLLTYTIIYFPPGQFQALAPYAVGIMKLEENPQLPGMIKNVKIEDLRVGMNLEVDFETATPKEWPRWPRYFFKPAS